MFLMTSMNANYGKFFPDVKNGDRPFVKLAMYRDLIAGIVYEYCTVHMTVAFGRVDAIRKTALTGSGNIELSPPSDEIGCE